MKKITIIILSAFLLGLAFVSIQATESIDNMEAQQLLAAIEAFGVSPENAKKATQHSIHIINEKKKASSETNQNNMDIVSDEFFTLQPIK